MNNKAREINSSIIKQLLDETTAEELAKIDAEMTNNKQQTAVEWLYNELLNAEPNILEWNKLLQQAKEMDKIQKFYMFNCGRQYQLTGEGTFKQVYNETYGGGEQ
jgi:hypothetical protein